MRSIADYVDLFTLIELSSLRSLAESVLHPLGFALFYPCVLAGFFVLERVFPWRRQQGVLRAGIALDVFYTIFNYSLLWMIAGTALSETTAALCFDAFTSATGRESLELVSLGALPTWARYACALLAIDLSSYLGHVLLHRFDFLWRFHKVHHSALELDVWNAGRIHFVEKFFYPFVFFVPLHMIGFELTDMLPIMAFTSIFSAFTHANVSLPLGPLKYVLNNPQLHLWHHARELDHRRNANYGDALSLWDYLFGTAYLPDARNEIPLAFDDIEHYPRSFAGHLAEPFRASGSLRPLALVAVSVALIAGGAWLRLRDRAGTATSPFAPRIALRIAPDYHERALRTLDERGADAALDAIDAASLLDLRAVKLIENWPRINVLARDGLTDAQVRTQIGVAIAQELSYASRAEPATFSRSERAIENAELAALLAPEVGAAQLALGLAYLNHGSLTRAPLWAIKAIAPLRRARALDPDDPSAAAALAQAESLVRGT